MTIEEKITRYRGIPRLIEDLQIDKEICTSVNRCSSTASAE